MGDWHTAVSLKMNQEMNLTPQHFLLQLKDYQGNSSSDNPKTCACLGVHVCRSVCKSVFLKVTEREGEKETFAENFLCKICIIQTSVCMFE